MNRRHSAITLAILLLAAANPVLPADDSLDRRLRAQSPDAVDCGRTDDQAASRTAVLDCAMKAFEARVPFRVRIEDSCVERVCSWGLFRDKPGGMVQIVPFDPKACTPANDTDPWCGTFGAAPCRNPRLRLKGKRLEVLCEGYSL